jgi:hypothetical protein
MILAMPKVSGKSSSGSISSEGLSSTNSNPCSMHHFCAVKTRFFGQLYLQTDQNFHITFIFGVDLRIFLGGTLITHQDLNFWVEFFYEW